MSEHDLDAGWSDNENPTLDDLARLIGPDLAEKLSVDFGGTRLYIPRNPGQHAPITVSIGIDAARLVGERFGGERCLVPVRAGRRARILSLREAGESVSAIARRIGCTERHVYDVLRERRDDRQMDIEDLLRSSG